MASPRNRYLVWHSDSRRYCGNPGAGPYQIAWWQGTSGSRAVQNRTQSRPMPETHTLLRRRGGEEGAKVEMVELFFDLVFVFAVTQLSHTLLRNLTLQGAFQVGLLLMALWWVWIYTSWVTNWLDPERIPVRVCL